MSLSDLTPENAAVDVAEGVAVGYWLHKARTDNDPQDSQGRIVPTPRVGNHAEYAGVVAGQVTAGHLLWPAVIHILVIPLLLFAGALGVGLTIGAYHLALLVTHHVAVANKLAGYVGLMCLVGWLFGIFFCVRGAFRLLIKRGPAIAYKNGYKGPLGLG